jgi:hypothetical protein
MRENRLYSSEGGARSNPSFLPLSDRDSVSRSSPIVLPLTMHFAPSQYHLVRSLELTAVCRSITVI